MDNNKNTASAGHALPGEGGCDLKTIVRFSPLLLLYALIVIFASSGTFQGDEGRYVLFAKNLLHGYYSPPDMLNLWNGPAYPVVLMPFVKFDLPWLSAKLMNALFMFIAVIYFFCTLRLYMSKRSAVFFSYLLGLYPPLLRYLHLLITETFAVFLVCAFMFHFCRLLRKEKGLWNHLLIASFYLGCLALTKIFFGYTILTGLLIFLALYLWKKKDLFKRTLLVYLVAFLCCVPYLAYTYSLTGKVFYFGNSGGMSLYWMSTPYQNEFGDWIGSKKLHENPQAIKNHQEFYKEFDGLSALEIDEAYKKRAFQNIVNNPLKFLQNWFANIGRLFFNYPYSYNIQKLSTYYYILPNMFLVVFSVFILYPTWLGRKSIPYEIYALLLFGFISLGGSSLLSAYCRQFNLILPINLLWISFMISNVIKVEIRE